jgi:two-component system, sporulation sensor kinase B
VTKFAETLKLFQYNGFKTKIRGLLKLETIFNFLIGLWQFQILIILIPIIILFFFTWKKYNVKKQPELLNVLKELDAVINAINSFDDLHNIEVKYFSTIEKDIFIIGNKFEFRQALINLIKNGMEASEKNGFIEIAIHEMLDSILIVIEDSGNVMTKEQMRLLGRPIPPTKETGTGLGIMVSYNIIRSMHGKVKVVSEEGKGTVFSIILPKAIGAYF